MNVYELYTKTFNELKALTDENEANRESLLALSFYMNIKIAEVMFHRTDEVDAAVVSFMGKFTSRRSKGEPLQYILGETEFMGLNFKVDKNVLIPRPETELLVEESLKIIKSGGKILDLCTGSGCIAISISSFLEDVEVVASDISREALNVAKNNAELNNVAQKITFSESDYFKNLNEYGNDFDIIVSNPPYISDGDREGLQREVREFEPHEALFSGPTGFEAYELIINESKKFLKEDGRLLVESGDNQAEEIKSIFIKNNFKEVEIINDLQGIGRVVKGKFRR